MKIGFNGNSKLGTNCVEITRPVGDTCPSTCPYLDGDCYQERIENTYPGVRPKALVNVVSNRNKIRAALLYSQASGMGFRFQVGGDWFRDGKLDLEYLADVEWACESIVSRGGSLEGVFFYTHVIDKRVAALSRFGIACYASIHNARDMRKARKAGFTLFAWGSLDDTVLPPAPRGGANHAKRLADWQASLPAVVEIGGERFVTCPNQRKGKRVTCTGSPDSLACGFCVNGRGNVAFARH
jgi:hypothetical protein